MDGIYETMYSKKNKDTFSPSSMLINGQTITDRFNITENCNNFFTSIAKNYNIRSIQLEEITPIILDILTQIRSSYHQPRLMK